MRLCDNCKTSDDDGETTVRPVDVGPEKGSQRDPYRSTIDLCDDCVALLCEGKVDDFAARNKRLSTAAGGIGLYPPGVR